MRNKTNIKFDLKFILKKILYFLLKEWQRMQYKKKFNKNLIDPYQRRKE